MKKALILISLIGMTGLCLVTGCAGDGNCGYNADTNEFIACDGDNGLAEGFNSDTEGGDSSVHTSSGSVVSDGQGFTGAVFNDGTGVTCGPDGGCIY